MAWECIVYVCAQYVTPNSVWDYTTIGEPIAPVTVGAPFCPTDVAQNSWYGSGTQDCPANSGFEDFPTAVGEDMYDLNITSLVASIQDERARRVGYVPTLTPYSFDSITTGDTIYGDHTTQEMMKDIKLAINQIQNVVVYNVTDGIPVRYQDIEEAKTKIDILRSECVCDGNCPAYTFCDCVGNCGCNY